MVDRKIVFKTLNALDKATKQLFWYLEIQKH